MDTKVNGYSSPSPQDIFNELKSIRKNVGVIMVALIFGMIIFYGAQESAKEQPAPKMEVLISPGIPVEINTLPDGIYNWVDVPPEGLFLAFVQSEADARLFAVASIEQVPPVFVVEKGKVKEWIPDLIVKNPLLEAPLAEAQKEVK